MAITSFQSQHSFNWNQTKDFLYVTLKSMYSGVSLTGIPDNETLYMLSRVKAMIQLYTTLYDIFV
jgi:hypothetical protein